MRFLQPALKDYDWGGFNFIRDFLNLEKLQSSPLAELWLGDYAQGAAKVIGENQTLDVFLHENPKYLSALSRARFGARLPFLLKILDVRLPLSIQVHPDKRQAEKGFLSEAHLSIDDQRRNYVDDNHKPESMVALSDFYLLHGFASLSLIIKRLKGQASLAFLLEILQKEGLETAYRYIFSLSKKALYDCLAPILNGVRVEDKKTPEYWIQSCVASMKMSVEALDSGLLSFYFLNIVFLRPGEGIFQGARLPHAYLYGQNVEIMARSNNVLRAGLTTKNIDIKALLNVIEFKEKECDILTGNKTGFCLYPAPVEDYALAFLTLHKKQSAFLGQGALRILLALEGRFALLDRKGQGKFLAKGEALLLGAEEALRLQALEEGARLVLASDGLLPFNCSVENV